VGGGKVSNVRRGQTIAAVLVLLLALLVGGYAFLDARLGRVQALADYPERPAPTPGTDWLIVGTDSREELTEAERQELGTGFAEGRRTDTMMLLHISDSGAPPTLVSLPRDSYVPIPGRERNKLNAAYSFGGPQLLVQTVEQVTGIRIDHYLEIGFGGFASIVDAVGGVELCPKEAMQDPMAGLNLPAGCQNVGAEQALAYVRTRRGGLGDLDRVQRQREFLSALMSRATSPGILLNPLRSVPLAVNGVDAIQVAEDDHLHHLASMGLSMRSISRGDGITTTVPVASTPTLEGVGSVVRWDRERALALFNALAADQPVDGLVEQAPAASP
jgi:LCP family protein required for cell wall assembly